MRKGDYIFLVSGKPFYFEDPRPSDFNIEDIAHALSLCCRFGCQCKTFYCLAPETRILTKNFDWKEIKDLKTNEQLFGFDEFPIKTNDSINRNKRKIRTSDILNIGEVYKSTYRIEFEDGTSIRCSEEHPWLVSTKVSRNQKWLTTKDLIRDLKLGRNRYLLRYFETWKEKKDYDGGYLAGVFDGEGCVSLGHENGGGFCLSLSQKDNEVFRKCVEILKVLNINYAVYFNENTKVNIISIKGKMHEKFKLFGKIKPKRLISNFNKKFIDKNLDLQSFKLVKIKNIYYQGIQKLIGMETSTKTFFAEGFGSHNSIAQHSILVASRLKVHCLRGLLHDASEAYIHDIVKPLKRIIEPIYGPIEEKIQNCIYERFGLDPHDKEANNSVKNADMRILSTEIPQLIPKRPINYEFDKKYKPYKNVKITPWDSKTARINFLRAFYLLTK